MYPIIIITTFNISFPSLTMDTRGGGVGVWGAPLFSIVTPVVERARIRLDEPLNISRAPGEVMAVCSLLSFMVEDVLRAGGDKKDVDANELVQSLSQRLHQAVAGIDPQVNVGTYLERTGLAYMFSVVAGRFANPTHVYKKDEVPSVHEYLGFVALLNQAISISHQLRTDLREGNHKYLAHQIALLYQTLTQLRDPSSQSLRKAIESRFEDVKAAIERTGVPNLTPELQAWLDGLLADVLSLRIPSPTTSKINPYFLFLQH